MTSIPINLLSNRNRTILQLVTACVFLLPTLAARGEESTTLRVMTFNLWHGGDAGKQPLEKTAEVIKQARADVVGLQETAGTAAAGQPRPDNAARLAALLGWHYLNQGGRTGIVSRFALGPATPAKWGVKILLPGGNHAYLFNAHFAHAPYQPYQLLSIPYAKAPFLKTAEEAVAAARAAREKQVERMLAEVRGVLPDNVPIFVTGDFNEPSHLDWTAAAAKARRCPLAVEWPTTKAVVGAGFVDAYRTVFPNPLKRPGWTWTPLTKETDPKDRHDRIDFVFARGAGVRIKSASILGEAAPAADVVIANYPSDHRAVVAEVEWQSK